MKNVETCIPAILVGNKIDLADNRQVTFNQAEERALSWSIRYIETSAKTKHNVDKVFCELMRIVRPFKQTVKLTNADQTNNTPDQDQNRRCCPIL